MSVTRSGANRLVKQALSQGDTEGAAEIERGAERARLEELREAKVDSPEREALESAYPKRTASKPAGKGDGAGSRARRKR